MCGQNRTVIGIAQRARRGPHSWPEASPCRPEPLGATSSAWHRLRVKDGRSRQLARARPPGLLGVEPAPRGAGAGEGWEAKGDGLRLGVHARGSGPGDTGSLPYLTVDDMATALERVHELGGA